MYEEISFLIDAALIDSVVRGGLGFMLFIITVYTLHINRPHREKTIDVQFKTNGDSEDEDSEDRRKNG